MIGLEPEFEIDLQAVLADETCVPLATLTARHEPLRTGFVPSMQPLMLTGLGRSGSTWMMRLLSEHPQIVAHRLYPYELRTFRYWMHMAKVLSEPADFVGSAHPDDFQLEMSWVGHNPFYPETVSVTAGLEQWFGRDYIKNLVAFAQRSSERSYERIAEGQDQKLPRYFAEKHRPDYLPWMTWEIYPNAREIFLVRDFRDVLASRRSFGMIPKAASGSDPGPSDAEIARSMRDKNLSPLCESWSRRRGRAHLVRYEDLVRRPKEILRGVFEHLQIDDDERTIAAIVERASQETADSARHRTSSGGVEGSIGRWRQDASPEAQAAYREYFADALELFGYPT